MNFTFEGHLDISKSWMNRALILQSFQPEIEIVGESGSQDVVLLKKALQDFKDNQTEFFVGLGGTTFRFLALRLSRKPGKYKIKAEAKLFKRPQNELVQILDQLQVKSFFDLENSEFNIDSSGWQPSSEILTIPAQTSSQFLSSFILSSLDLNFNLKFKTDAEITSESYFKYTLDIMQGSGFKMDFSNGIYSVAAHQKLQSKKLIGEVDVSSFFTLATAAVLNGSVHLKNWTPNSTQPDMKFVHFFKSMGIKIQQDSHSFKIEQQSTYQAVSADLGSCPDLFPVLAVLCAFANGTSILSGAAQLMYKESDRITKTYELLHRFGFKVEKLTDGLIIHGNPNAQYRAKDLFYFNPDHDHRMAFAATLLRLKNFPVIVTEPEVIKKSYPQFYQHVGLQL